MMNPPHATGIAEPLGDAEDSDDLSVLDAMRAARGEGLRRRNRRAATLAGAALLGALAWLCATLTWSLTGVSNLAALAPSGNLTMAAGAGGPAPISSAAAVRAVVGAEPFGALATASLDSGLPPATRLDLVLKGIVFTEVAADARAIIAAGGGSQSAFSIGHSVGGHARLVEIRPNLVVLERDGQRETLRLEQSEERRAVGAPTPDRRIDQRGDYQLARTLGGFQARLKTNPAAAMSLLRLQPERDGEHMLGVRLFPGPEPGLLERVGLQPGDVVTHVNQVRVDSPSAGLEALRELTAAAEVHLSIRRDERRLDYSFSIAQ